MIIIISILARHFSLKALVLFKLLRKNSEEALIQYFSIGNYSNFKIKTQLKIELLNEKIFNLIN